MHVSPKDTIHAEIIGDRTLPRIVFLHGFLGSKEEWRSLALSIENRYSSLIVDLPGHGEAPSLEVAARTGFFERTAEALAQIISVEASPPCFLVGYSMGGRLALFLALRFPELFSKVIILSASPGLQTLGERSRRQKQDDQIARKIEKNFEGFLRFWYEQPLFFSLKNHPRFRETEQKRQQNNPGELALALRLLGTGVQPSLWDELADNRIPIAFFAGEKDPKFVEIGMQMVKLCPSSNLEIFADCGHALHIENREEFTSRLKVFFKQ
ncbi:2-succinyl-6-hydroxy-2,4-cyclohexadiene-1-carboxylate synthase [Chlorobium phaeobacteroides]|jgi:2-succinyl-6-hydroxy-2,4-cyclohexadiene-1-carboxylate synthase|uniref:Putative 2-succinyl-6-hydroxy-2,4-cyclohexadiene-1-carboxylate synthase n=1 Tax=Chlorobium phaeobacteroides (strain DSM 266 / SMG 266 / 2430) TaxID=290317 RepID=A1BI75_CHLPD|nr:2-succinyl-6-hydroxy-2,4-cyclohexadiene-1-carboxylate synthase [Chlorobium phaeobacteroides]ABL66102.1 alpha/beta hydrolase fold protein [Chlorobium phaeobacteroides DSM 266]MBV5319634.1 2-succinyl-6-hydroxy-2,4-cyclohexadiene-1-carboxylate synthase [Chlorobium phaeobacteroides]